MPIGSVGAILARRKFSQKRICCRCMSGGSDRRNTTQWIQFGSPIKWS